ncbi:MAG: MarR family transcriptional regulator [Phycisphaerales bacterium]|nr:MarR family transcriptional regulator [Phycisphaerales bacterium]
MSSGSSTTGSRSRLAVELGKKNAFEMREQEAYLNLVRTVSVLSRDFAVLFKSFGVSETQYNALRIIAGAGKKGIRMEMIGERMVARDPDTTRLINRLLVAGYVLKERLEDDRRCSVVCLTGEGRALLKRMRGKVDRLHAEQLGHMKASDLDQLNRLLVTARERAEE